MPDESALVRQWRPLAFKAAARIARSYHATEQERADICDLAPTVLWRCIREGWLLADTSVGIAFCIVYRQIIHSIRDWRMNTYHVDKKYSPDGKYRFGTRPVNTLSDLYGDDADAVAANLPAREAEASVSEGLAALVAVLARLADLTEFEARLLMERAEEVRQQDTATATGRTRESIYLTVSAARKKLLLHADAVRDLLS